jgi:hypothetical protein
MPNDETPPIPAGWIGGFAESDKRFAYPTPDLRSLDMLKNMDNIDLLERQQAVLWPEFSWESEPGRSDPKRCHQMFASDISRLGYTDQGRVYSIICPQQGVESPSFGSINLEVTVTGQRGWVDEDTRALACDMSVEARAWFAPGYHESSAVKLLWKLLDEFGHDFPISKDKAIVVSAHKPGHPDQPIFRLSKGESKRFAAPEFARHSDEAWSVGHLEAEIGPIEPTHVTAVDDFNRLFLDIFNMSSGNMLKAGNVLTWNVWFNHPELVDQDEWRDHAEKWRRSIDIDHTSPDRQRSPARLHDGSLFNPAEELIEEEISKIYDFIRKQLSPRQSLARTSKSLARSLHVLPKSLGG